MNRPARDIQQPLYAGPLARPALPVVLLAIMLTGMAVLAVVLQPVGAAGQPPDSAEAELLDSLQRAAARCSPRGRERESFAHAASREGSGAIN